MGNNIYIISDLFVFNIRGGTSILDGGVIMETIMWSFNYHLFMLCVPHIATGLLTTM